MIAADVIAVGAISALGEGRDAYSVGELGERPKTAIAEDALLVQAGLKRPFCARAPESAKGGALPSVAGRAQALLERAAGALVSELDEALPDWRKSRIALAVGSSAADMGSQMQAFESIAQGDAVAPVLARSVPYFGPMAPLETLLGIEPVLSTQVLCACASSTVAVGLACRWLEQDRADLVIAGGYDALSVFVAAGFEALGATSNGRPAPFAVSRDGMAMGEGAALVALTLDGRSRCRSRGKVLGFGASTDAVHVTAPDRTGAGLASAAQGALADAGANRDDIDLVSAHATATPFNDAAESKAIATVLGGRAPEIVVHPFKAVIGHTLGAAGLLESLAALDAIDRGILPAAASSPPFEAEFSARLLEVNQRGKPKTALKLSAAFGGANAAIVVGARSFATARPRPKRNVRVLSVGRAQHFLDSARVAQIAGIDAHRLERLDSVSELAVAACADAIERSVGPLPQRTGIVVGSMTATLEINDRYDRRRRVVGARAVEPRRFPATSPNLCCGQCAIAFGLLGPSLAIDGGLAAPLEALLVAADLVEAGDAAALLVVAVEDRGPIVDAVWSAAGWPIPERGALAVLIGSAADGAELHRDQVLELWRQAHRQARQALDASGPGWPMLLRAVAEATSARD
jgi:3-oxoacyl-[acyl-carrier-protein] synthase-1/3-oxoacyl-[acyl-carrier-protein] synthase II